MAFKRSWVRFLQLHQNEIKGLSGKRVALFSFPQPTLRQRVLSAPLEEQHKGSQKRASMSSRKRPLEFFQEAASSFDFLFQ